MGIMDKLKDFMNVQDEDVYDEEIDFGSDYETEESRDISSSSRRASRDDYSNDYSSPRSTREEKRSNGKYVNIHATTQLQVVLVKPEGFQDATSIADHLNQKRTVVVNLESANKEVSRRLIDFLSGVAYAIQGNLKRVAHSTYIITPFNVDFMGDELLDELENYYM